MDRKECIEVRQKLIAEKASLETSIKNTTEQVNTLAQELGIEPTKEAFEAKKKEVEEQLQKIDSELSEAIKKYEELNVNE